MEGGVGIARDWGAGRLGAPGISLFPGGAAAAAAAATRKLQGGGGGGGEREEERGIGIGGRGRRDATRRDETIGERNCLGARSF